LATNGCRSDSGELPVWIRNVASLIVRRAFYCPRSAVGRTLNPTRQGPHGSRHRAFLSRHSRKTSLRAQRTLRVGSRRTRWMALARVPRDGRQRHHSRGARRARGHAKSCPSGNQEGAGNAGCLMHPQPRVLWKKAHELVTTGPPRHSGIPCTMAYDLFRVLPGETGLCCHRRLSEDSRDLAPASGRRDHTASPSAKECRSSCDTLHVHRIPPRVRDDASAPRSESG
jgi:hypothetical protein